jgi:hypothetical protein
VLTGSGGEMKYGQQRVWGTIGFGITALLAGSAIDWWSAGSSTKDYTPAFVVVLIFAIMDIICCSKLRVRHSFGNGNKPLHIYIDFLVEDTCRRFMFLKQYRDCYNKSFNTLD